MRLAPLAADLIDLFLPRGCLACGDRIPPEDSEDLVCARCRTRLRPPPPPLCSRCHAPFGTGRPAGSVCLECADWPEVLRSARAAVVMEPPADALVHALKYGGWRSLGEFMGRRMAAACRPVIGEPIAVPVPTTPKRQRIRGYNQAEVLGDVVARELGIPLVRGLDRPTGGTQVSSGPLERRRNVEGSFRVPSSVRSRIRGREVILIDDVLTTGATALSATAALGEKGAGSVHVLTFARALPFGDLGRRTPVG